MRLAFSTAVFSAALAVAASATPSDAAGVWQAKRTGLATAHAHVVEVSHNRAWRRRHWNRHHDVTVVDAPFTYVETRHRRHVAVDAPFTNVRVGRRGVWVRAPFVNLYVPH